MAMDGPSPEIPEDYSYSNEEVELEMKMPEVSINVVYPDPEQRWEYKYIPLPSIETLNELGAIGWQVVMYLQTNNSFLLIRQIVPETEEQLEERLERMRQMSMSDEEVGRERREHSKRQFDALLQERDRIQTDILRGRPFRADTPEGPNEEPGE